MSPLNVYFAGKCATRRFVICAAAMEEAKHQEMNVKAWSQNWTRNAKNDYLIAEAASSLQDRTAPGHVVVVSDDGGLQGQASQKGLGVTTLQELCTMFTKHRLHNYRSSDALLTAVFQEITGDLVPYESSEQCIYTDHHGQCKLKQCKEGNQHCDLHACPYFGCGSSKRRQPMYCDVHSHLVDSRA